MEELTVHAYDWVVKDQYDENGHVVIHCWSMDRDSNPYLLRFHDFPAYCHVELPLYVGNRRMMWSSYKAQQVFESICWMTGDNKPFKYFFQQKEKLYYYRGGKRYPMLILLFDNIRSMNSCRNRLSKPFKVKDLGTIACKVWESKIPIVRKLLTLRKVKYCQWFNIQGVKVTGEDKVSTLENEYVVDRSTMNPISLDLTKSWVTQPTFLAFDIETYSDRHNALPDPYSSLHVSYMVSCVYQKIGDPTTRKKIIILLGECNDIKDVEVIQVQNEMELIDKMSDLIIEYDPTIISGYNIFGYDWPYLDTRLKRRMREWKSMGRLFAEPSEMKSFSWGSSGYGQNEINMLQMDGRINIDMLPIIRRDYKLALYNLNYVANYFLGRGKHDVSAKQMFQTYELQQAAIKSGDPTLIEQAKVEMTKVVEYCVVDSDLVVDIFEKIHCWIGLVEMSNVVGVTLVELFTRGQQIRALSQVYDESSNDGIVIDERTVPKMHYSGGFVYQPVPGIYHNIPCFDFKSLYPTVMISHNICPRTFVPEEKMDLVPDADCHVIEWEEDEILSKEDIKKGIEPKKVHFKYKFVKKDVLQGIFPRLLVRLIDERDAVRKDQKNYEKGSLNWIVLERRQLALKITANSLYGTLGAQVGGKIPLPEAAACVTAKSRESILKVNEYLESKGHKIVYGDSVTGDTPILCQENGLIEYKLIRDIFRFSVKHGDKEYGTTNLRVWSDKGFTKIKHVMRHRTRKRLYRIIADNGIVTVTEDHSLLDNYSNMVTPKQVSVGSKLLWKALPEFSNPTLLDTSDPVKAAKYYWTNPNKVCSYENGHYIFTDGTVDKGTIKRIEDLGYVDDYVYDLETENHHFSAGVGELVVHNTDSSMPDIGITDSTKAYAQAKEMAIELSKLFPPPMLVEDEEVFHTMFCIKKKMYLCIRMQPDGTPIMNMDEIKTKGVCLARRDNCEYKRECYRKIAWNTLRKRPMMETYNEIIDMCLRLVRRQVPWKKLVSIKGLGSNYKNKSYSMKIFSDELIRIGKPAAPGDRLEYVIVKSHGIKGSQLLGYKMRLPKTYLERLESDTPEQIDYEYYMEKLLMNVIQKQLFQIGYNKELQALEEKYLSDDQDKVLAEIRAKGHGTSVDTLHQKFNGDKAKIIDYFIEETKLAPVVKKLVSYHIKKRGRLVTRINGEPVKMMVKLIQAKAKWLEEMKNRSSNNASKVVPAKKKIKLKITESYNIQNWIQTKTKQMQDLAK